MHTLRWNSWKDSEHFEPNSLMKKEKMENMEELIKSLEDKQWVSSQQHNLLDHNFGGVSKCLFENQMENSSRQTFISLQFWDKTICNDFVLLFPKSI